MRLVNRPLAFILAAALTAACVVIIAEVIGFAEQHRDHSDGQGPADRGNPRC
jgi:hypothetical protein